MSSKVKSSLSRTWSRTTRLTQIPPGSANAFEPGGDVDAVAVDVVVVADDVAEIDADAELDAPLGRHIGIALGHLALHLDRAAHRIDDAGEFDQHAVAGGFDDAAAMLRDLGIDEFAPDRLQRRERAFLVVAHQPRIAGDIGRQNRRQSPFDPLLAHVLAQTTRMVVS